MIPKEILEAARESQAVIELDMGEYSWTISGDEIAASDLKDINLEVKKTEEIPNSVVEQLAGDRPVQQISLTHEGNFGFKATLKIHLGTEYKGKTGNLFYYDSTGKLIFISAGAINEEGDVFLDFSHASDYAIVIDEAVMDEGTSDNTEQNPDTDEKPDESQTQNPGENNGADTESPQQPEGTDSADKIKEPSNVLGTETIEKEPEEDENSIRQNKSVATSDASSPEVYGAAAALSALLIGMYLWRKRQSL